MTVRTFGRKGSDDTGMARRREAFIAEERAQRACRAQEGATAAGAPILRESAVLTERPIFAREKSLAIAYLWWFLCGAISAHRFYLGFPISALAQASLWIVGALGLASGFLPAGFGLLAAFLWVLADLFLIPSLCRSANERARQNEAAYAFT